MVKLVPTEDNILVEPIEEEETTKSGIVLPETAKKKPVRGKVVAVGEGRMLESGHKTPLFIEVGDIVHFTEHMPDPVEVEENGEKKKYYVLNQGSVLVKEKEEEEDSE